MNRHQWLCHLASGRGRHANRTYQTGAQYSYPSTAPDHGALCITEECLPARHSPIPPHSTSGQKNGLLSSATNGPVLVRSLHRMKYGCLDWRCQRRLYSDHTSSRPSGAPAATRTRDPLLRSKGQCVSPCFRWFRHNASNAPVYRRFPAWRARVTK